MGGFKRFVFAVYGLVSIFALVMLGLTWYGPWSKLFSALLGIGWLYRAVEACAVVCLGGLVFILCRGLFSSRVDAIEVTKGDGSAVTVTRDAIASRATKIVEADGTCIADEVFVSAKRRGDIRVRVRVQPVSTIDVLGTGEELQAELKRGLADLCGSKLRSVRLEFTEPQTESYPSASASDATGTLPAYGASSGAYGSGVAAHDAEDASQVSSVADASDAPASDGTQADASSEGTGE